MSKLLDFKFLCKDCDRRFPYEGQGKVEKALGLQSYANLCMGKCSKKNLREEERLETETALDQLLFMTITFFDDME